MNYCCCPDPLKTDGLPEKKMVIGVTGSLACGKTTVTDIFVSMGAERIDADVIAHEILDGDEEVKENIRNIFGPDIFSNGNIDRRALSDKVFDMPDKLGQLEKIIHPVILTKIRAEISNCRKGLVVVDAPLLFEAGIDSEMDLVVVVSADEEIMMQRAEKKGISAQRARKIIDIQMSQSEKIKKADVVIENNGDIEKLKEGVKNAWQKKRKK